MADSLDGLGSEHDGPKESDQEDASSDQRLSPGLKPAPIVGLKEYVLDKFMKMEPLMKKNFSTLKDGLTNLERHVNNSLMTRIEVRFNSLQERCK